MKKNINRKLLFYIIVLTRRNVLGASNNDITVISTTYLNNSPLQNLVSRALFEVL